MDILKIITFYEQLRADVKKLEQLEILVKTNKERQILRSLDKSNQRYRFELISLIQGNFPATATDVANWSEEELSGWLNLLIEHPIFWQGKQEILIGLFWSLDSKGFLQNHASKVALLCTHLEMVAYAADFHNKSVVKTLNALIDKYATLSQAEIFQNRVDLVVNEIY